MKYFCKLFFVFLLLGQFSFAQKAGNPVLHSAIKVIAKAYDDSVVLRWAPTRPWAWSKLNYIGYKIERIDINEKDNAKKELLTPIPLKPYSLEKFKASFKPEHHNAAIAAQCLYGKNFDTNLRPGQSAIEDKASVSDARYAYTLMVSDFDANVGVATALRFTDKTAKKGNRYIYRVMPAGPATQGTIDTGTVLIINTKTAVSNKPAITEGLAFDQLSELHWNRAGNETWSGYFIERSEDGNTFTALNELPFISSAPDSTLFTKDTVNAKPNTLLLAQHIYIDSLPQNYKNYTYRIRGINAFAELSDYSNTVNLAGRDMTPPSAVNILNPQYISGTKIKVIWKKDLIEKDCRGYFITRAHNINGPYETLNQQPLPPTASEFIDNNAFAHGGSYYIVVTADTANNIASSSPAMGLVPDNTPPASPTGLKGTIGRNGIVELHWTASKEEDLKGYKVYFANAADHVFTQITTEPDSLNSFTDSINLKTLTKDIWYRIAAVDYNNNHSEFSAPVKLRKPDIVPPTAPMATNILVKRNAVDMDWIQSSSTDAANYIVYRQPAGGERGIIARVKHNPSVSSFHYTDTTMKANLSYTYTAEAVDEDSLHSPPSIPVEITVRVNPERQAITSLKAVYEDKSGIIKLSWQYSSEGDYFFIIYRAMGEDALQKWRSVAKDANVFSDINTVSGKKYRYAIQAVHKDGRGNTRVSAVVEVNR